MKTSLLRTLLVLGRTSNLPTVWSNLLMGWMMGGGTGMREMLLMGGGASFLYVGGMYMNDACDVEFDLKHRSERPIPAHSISAKNVWVLTVIWFALGMMTMIPFGWKTTSLALILLALIISYNIVHKKTILAPLLMGGCRAMLYLLAASITLGGISEVVLWAGAALAAYVAGLSYLARNESTHRRSSFWPWGMILSPLLFAVWIYLHEGGMERITASLLFLGWLAWCARLLYRSQGQNLGAAVARLLAGIVCVDMVLVGTIPTEVKIIFGILFGLTLLFQRFIPAT